MTSQEKEEIEEDEIKPIPTKEELAEWFQINMTIIGSKGALKQESEFEVLTKEELLDKLDETLPEEEFGYSIVIGLNEEHKGI